MDEGQFEGQPNAGAGTPDNSEGLRIIQRSGRFSASRGQHEIAILTTHADVQRAADDAKHKREETTRDNEQRRNIVYAVVLVVIAGLVVGSLVGTMAENDTTRTWAQGIVTLLLGGLLGAVGGYFTAKAGK